MSHLTCNGVPHKVITYRNAETGLYRGWWDETVKRGVGCSPDEAGMTHDELVENWKEEMRKLVN